MDSRSKETLRRIEQNDTGLTQLWLGDSSTMGGFISSDSRDYSTIGSFIANNTSLEKLMFCKNDECALDNSNKEFFDGIRRNKSIQDLTLYYAGQARLDGGVGQELLKVYREENNLTRLCVGRAILWNGEDDVIAIANTLRRCTNLKDINLGNNDITDEQLMPIVEAIRGHHELNTLSLVGNRITDAGCGTIATLLEDPNCNLEVLYLHQNRILLEGASTIINSLVNTTSLKRLELDHYPLDLISRLLCDTSSIGATYSSNHTLASLPGLPFARELFRMNRSTTNKSHVAIKKILKYHPNIDMEPLFEWDADGEQTLKALPYVIDWFDRAGEAVADGNEEEYRVEERKLSATFQFAKAMPLMIVPGTHIKVVDRKRKRGIV